MRHSHDEASHERGHSQGQASVARRQRGIGTGRENQAVDLEAELRKFEEEERKRLGLDGKTEQWIEEMANLTFTKKERAHITILVSGLTMAHDYFVEGALRGIGYHVQMIDCPDVAALQYGKEFGNRGQCNPAYFTVGNLVKYLCTLRDKHGMSSKEIVPRSMYFSLRARAGRASSECTSPSTERRSETQGSMASASSYSSRPAD